jgi:hypothetical protein
VLVRFQNPSIRDYVQNLLLCGELLPEVIASLVFFEQGHWFWEILRDEKSQAPPEELERHADAILDALERLIDVSSCSFSVEVGQSWQRISLHRAHPANRLATIAQAVSCSKGRNDGMWIVSKIFELASKIETKQISSSSCVALIAALKESGHLATGEGDRLISAIKASAMSEPIHLEDFETVARLIGVFPICMRESELETVRDAYSDFADRYPGECDISNPDELREEASRIGNVGDVLQVDTAEAQDALRKSADEIERQEQSAWDDDDRQGGGCPDVCSDAELDSMFCTLGA